MTKKQKHQSIVASLDNLMKQEFSDKQTNIINNAIETLLNKDTIARKTRNKSYDDLMKQQIKSNSELERYLQDQIAFFNSFDQMIDDFLNERSLNKLFDQRSLTGKQKVKTKHMLFKYCHYHIKC
jgi:hypothetical protein